MVTCLSGVTNCHGQLIDNFRYWMLQMAMMDKILEVCPNMQYGGLKNIVRNTSMFQYTIWAGIKTLHGSRDRYGNKRENILVIFPRLKF